MFRGLAEQKESSVEEGRLMVDHVHMLSAVGKGEAAARRCIKEQEQEDKRLEQMEMAAL